MAKYEVKLEDGTTETVEASNVEVYSGFLFFHDGDILATTVVSSYSVETVLRFKKIVEPPVPEVPVKKPHKKRNLTDEARKAISEAQKARWAARKAAKQKEAIDRACAKMHRIREIFAKVASEIHQTVPDGTDNKGWKFGSFRILSKSGEYYINEYGDVSEMNRVTPELDGVDLSKVGYIAIWRQTARNKRTQEVKGFAAWIPDCVVECVEPGQTIDVKEYLSNDTKDEEIERLARESFMKLQDMVNEYYEA